MVTPLVPVGTLRPGDAFRTTLTRRAGQVIEKSGHTEQHGVLVEIEGRDGRLKAKVVSRDLMVERVA